MLKVQGRSDLFLILEIIKQIIGLAPLFVGAFVGIIPMLYVNIATGIISYFLNSYYSGKLLGYSSWMQIKDVSSSYGVASLVALSVWFMKYLPISNWVILPLQIFVGIIIFVCLCRIFNFEEYQETKKIVIPYISKLERRR
jgi:type III secretory pathway component EscV